MARRTDEMAKLKIGHALDADTNIGLVVNQGQLDQDLEYIGIGKSEGAKLFDGEFVRRSTEGSFCHQCCLPVQPMTCGYPEKNSLDPWRRLFA